MRRVLDSIPALWRRASWRMTRLRSQQTPRSSASSDGASAFLRSDDSASRSAQITWLRDGLESTLDAQDLVLSVSGLTFWRITVSDGSDWLSGLWMEWKNCSFCPPASRSPRVPRRRTPLRSPSRNAARIRPVSPRFAPQSPHAARASSATTASMSFAPASLDAAKLRPACPPAPSAPPPSPQSASVRRGRKHRPYQLCTVKSSLVHIVCTISGSI